MTSFLPFRQQVWCVVATASARIKAVRSWTRRKRTCLSTARTEQTLLIRCISEQKNSRIRRFILLLLREFCSVILCSFSILLSLILGISLFVVIKARLFLSILYDFQGDKTLLLCCDQFQ